MKKTLLFIALSILSYGFTFIPESSTNNSVISEECSAEDHCMGQDHQLYIRVFKWEGELELWGKTQNEEKFHHLKTYDLCMTSGALGPKRVMGDLQIPEGYYKVNHFNPESRWHYSLGINYPNRSDRILGHKKHPGGSIYIHGGCRTVGCIPITDIGIADLYDRAYQAHLLGQKDIDVHIFPTRMEEENLTNLGQLYPEHLNFWWSLKRGYDQFEHSFMIPRIKVGNRGEYVYN